MQSGTAEPGKRDWLYRLIAWQAVSIAFGLAVVWWTLRLEWRWWQMLLAYYMGKDMMSGATGLITPEIRAWAERVIWRRSRGISAFWCASHIHPWFIPIFFPSLHDLNFAIGMHGMCVLSAILLHRFPLRYRGQFAALLAGMAALLATRNGVPEGFEWMTFLYPAKVILCWWLPVECFQRREG